MEEIRSEMKLEKDATMEEARKSAAQCIKAVKAIENAQDRLVAMLEGCSGLLRQMKRQSNPLPSSKLPSAMSKVEETLQRVSTMITKQEGAWKSRATGKNDTKHQFATMFKKLDQRFRTFTSRIQQNQPGKNSQQQQPRMGRANQQNAATKSRNQTPPEPKRTNSSPNPKNS